MNCTIDCVHCYLKQAVSAMRLAGVDLDTQHDILYKLMDYVKGFDRKKSPAENSTKILKKVYELIGNSDPYNKAKKHSNDLAMSLYPFVEEIAVNSVNPLHEALKISAAGNIIDLGIQRSFDIEGELKNCIKNGFVRDDYDLFCDKLNKTDEVLILGDNSGEIVFDKILIKELVKEGKKVVYTVKSGPVLNDATMEDAIYTGIDKYAKVVATGSDYLGVSLENSSDEFLRLLDKSQLIISKGQANFESLEHIDEYSSKTFFLLKIKCEEVANAIGNSFGDVVFFTKC